MQFILAIRAHLTCATYARKPFDAGSITDLPYPICIRANSKDEADSFVLNYSVGAILHRHSAISKFVEQHRSVGGTQPGSIDFNKNL
jgi:hypothetical protein